MERRRADGQQGFVITLELILIFTILGIGLLVGIVAIRNALVVWWAKKRANTVWVYDSGSPAQLLGPARDFDEHEAPRLFYIDRDVPWCVPFGDPGCTDIVKNYRAFVGVRDDRFTTRPRVFYSELGCTGTPCLPDVSNEAADNLGIGFLSINIDSNNDGTIDSSTTSRLQNAGGVGYLYALQRGPNYGVGADVDQTFNGSRLPGTLYRQSAQSCEDPIRSVWTSQEVVPGEPCLNLPDGLVVESAKCPSGQVGTNDPGEPCNVSPNVDPRCVVGGVCDGGVNMDLSCYEDSHCPGSTCSINPPSSDAEICACPVGWAKDTGANCCPPGSTHNAIGQCEIGTTGVFFEAVPVQLGGGNAFAGLTPPFKVNLPPDTTDFVTTAPGGFEGAPAGPVTGTYDGDVSFDFDVPASGGESGPP